jgi:hypothetical protein
VEVKKLDKLSDLPNGKLLMMGVGEKSTPILVISEFVKQHGEDFTFYVYQNLVFVKQGCDKEN